MLSPNDSRALQWMGWDGTEWGTLGSKEEKKVIEEKREKKDDKRKKNESKTELSIV